jgi:hypothetical protein
MKICKIIVTLSSLALLAACGGPGEEATVPQAQPAEASFVDIGDHVVHFSAQLTDQLPLNVAQTYDIERNPNRAMLNVSVLEEGSNKAVPAEVSVNTVNLTGQLKDVTMRRINEQTAIYYIGETDVRNQEVLIFDINIKPEGVEESSAVRFQRQFYTK